MSFSSVKLDDEPLSEKIGQANGLYGQSFDEEDGSKLGFLRSKKEPKLVHPIEVSVASLLAKKKMFSK